MEHRRRRIVLTDLVSIWLMVSLLGCSLAWEPVVNPSVSETLMVPVVARVLDEQLAVVAPVLEEHGEISLARRSLLGETKGIDVVERMLTEQQGADYLRFSHAVATGASSEEVLAEAANLLPDEQFSALSARMVSTQRALGSIAMDQVRSLPPSQRPAFMRDLQKLVTKTLVLMVAGIVYACIPTVVFWGKVTAAAAISVAAGITATTIMSIYRYYQYGEGTLAQSFQEWIIDVTTDPAAAYAVAASMTTIGKTMTNGPVVTGLIIVVFALYQVMDLVKPMLKKYNFDA